MKAYTCELCGFVVDGDDMDEFIRVLTDHGRSVHDWPYPDGAIRNFAHATQRVTGPTDRLDQIDGVEVRLVTPDRIGDWLAFFDRDAFAGAYAWASCYCSEPHCLDPRTYDPAEARSWEDNRALMVDLLTSGRSTGYLAYSAGRVAGWVNASVRSEYALYRRGDGADTADDDVIGVSCFLIAPPFRRHGIAAALLDRVIADAPSRSVSWIEAYPFNEEARAEVLADFRGSPKLFAARGFTEVEQRERDTVVRRPV